MANRTADYGVIEAPIRQQLIQTLLTAALGFLWKLVRGNGLAESLKFAGSLFLLIALIRIMWIVIPRLKARGW